MKIIDFHTHIFPDRIAESAMRKLAQTADIPAYTDGTASGLERKLQECGIEKGVALHIATKPSQQRKINDWAISFNNDSNSKIISFAAIFPADNDVIAELEYVKSLGFTGVKTHPDYQGIMVDDERMFPFLRKMQDLNLIWILHAGFDPVSPNLVHAPPKAIAKIAKLFPELTIVAAHMGGAQMYDQAGYYLSESPNVYFDTSMSGVYCDFDVFAGLIANKGCDHILFGSDCPWSNPQKEIEFVNRLNIPQHDKQKIFYDNAAKLLNLNLQD